MPQEWLEIFLGWVAVISMPVLIATIILAGNAKRKRVNPARSSRTRHSPSDRAAIDGCLVLFGSEPGEMNTGLNQVGYGLQSRDGMPIDRLT